MYYVFPYVAKCTGSESKSQSPHIRMRAVYLCTTVLVDWGLERRLRIATSKSTSPQPQLLQASSLAHADLTLLFSLYSGIIKDITCHPLFTVIVLLSIHFMRRAFVRVFALIAEHFCPDSAFDVVPFHGHSNSSVTTTDQSKHHLLYLVIHRKLAT